jgi:hypothetical protein
MKKFLRILVAFSIAASSILFASPSQAAVIGGVTVTTAGNITATTLSGNSIYYTSNGGSYGVGDKIIFDISGRQFELANLSEADFTSSFFSDTNRIGIPATPVVGYDVTINVNMGYAYLSSGDIYVEGTRVLQNFYPSFQGGGMNFMIETTRRPFVQFNYLASTGEVSVLVAGTSSSANVQTYINSDGTFSVTDGTINSWLEVTKFTIGAPVVTAPIVTAPGAPNSVTASSTGKRSATVSFAAPASNGGSAITSYTATSSPGGLTQTLTQATSGTFNFDDLQPGTIYTFAVTATNAIGTSAATPSNSVTTTPLVVASLSSLSFVDDGTGTGGKIVWSGTSIDAVLYTGSSAYYPGPYNYGAFSSGWNGRIRNLTPATEYTVSLFVVSADGVGESKSLTFKTSATLPALAGAKSETISRADEMTAQLPKLFAWIDENTFVEGEGNRMKMMLNKFDALVTSPHRSHIKVPTSRVLNVVATSQTPLACSVVSATAKENTGVVKALSGDTCTISYTVSGGSKAPATMIKDFVFKKFG